MKASWQKGTDHLVCQWYEVRERAPYNPPWMLDASNDIDRKNLLPSVLDFTKLSPFGGSEWYTPRSDDVFGTIRVAPPSSPAPHHRAVSHAMKIATARADAAEVVDKIIAVFKKRFRNDETLRCSFCNKSQDHVESLISNRLENPVRVYICNECVAVCKSILESKNEKKAPK